MTSNWDHLRFFLALVRHPTLPAAASRLGVSPSTVSRRIQQFEAEVEGRLFDHTPDGYVLTDAGARLLVHAEQVEAAMVAIARDVAGADTRVAGTVIIGTVEVLAVLVLPPIVVRLKADHPDLDLQLRVSAQVLDLTRREADVAIRITPNPPESLIGRRGGEITMIAAASRDYLAQHPVSTMPTALGGGHRFLLDTCHADLPPNGFLARAVGDPAVTVADCLVTTAALCSAGLGLAVLPALLVHRDPNLVPLPLETPMPPTPIWVLTHRDLRHTARIRTVMVAVAEGLSAVFAANGTGSRAWQRHRGGEQLGVGNGEGLAVPQDDGVEEPNLA